MNTGATSAAGAATTATIERAYIATGLTYDALVRAFEAELGHWDAESAKRLVERKAPWNEVEQAVTQAAGPRGLMILAKVDQGAVLSYDRPSSFLAALGKPELDEIGALLDGKIDGVAQAVTAMKAGSHER